MSELTERLRDYTEEVLLSSSNHAYEHPAICTEAADRIEALEAAVSETYRRLMNAQPTIGNASNASFIDNHIDPCMAILKDLLPDPENGNG